MLVGHHYFQKQQQLLPMLVRPLSHAAIVARELGIPAVVGTGNATMETPHR